MTNDLRKAESELDEGLRLGALLWPRKMAAELRRLHEENEQLRQALAQPEQEPVAIVNEGMGGIEWLSSPLPDDTPLYAAPVDVVSINQECVDEMAKHKHDHVVGMFKETLPEQNPPQWVRDYNACLPTSVVGKAIRHTPPKREWQRLTGDDKHFLLANAWNKEQAFDGFMDAIDKFLEEKNT